MLIRIFFTSVVLINMLFPCAVCYGNPEDPMSKGMNMGVLTLIGFIGFVLCVVAYSIILISLKSKKIDT